MPDTVRRPPQVRNRARELYARGLKIWQIADTLGVPRATVSVWKMSDGQHGLSWDKEREETSRLDPDQVLRDLEGRFARLVVEGAPSSKEDTAEQRRYEQRLLTMIRVIMGYRKTARTPISDLRVLEGFATFCADNLPPDDLAAARRALELFIEHLRKENE